MFIDLTAEPPFSRTEVRFSCHEAGASTFAELTAGPMCSAMLNGQSLAQPGDGRLTLPDLAPRNVLTVETHLAYSSSARGLARFEDAADDATYVLITAYPTSAPDIFCCFDQPDLSAAMTFSVHAPAGWECIGNAPVMQRPSTEADGTWRFETMPAMRPYDVALCAGPFTCDWRADGPVRLTAQRRRSLTGADGIMGLTWFGELARTAIERYERVLKIPCPYTSYDIVVMPNLAPMALSVHAQDHRLAQAYAQGLWLPGQETTTKEFSERYFAEALPALASRDYQAKRVLGRDLFPSTIITAATVAAATAVIEAGELDGVLADVVTQLRAVVQGALLARSATRRPELARWPVP